MNDQTFTLCSKVASLCGLVTSTWTVLGLYQAQIAAVCAMVCTLVAVLTYLRGNKKDE